MGTLSFIILFVLISAAITYFKPSLIIWSAASIVMLIAGTSMGMLSVLSAVILWVLILAPIVVLNMAQFRRQFITKPIYQMFKKKLPAMSRTEREALDAGDPWFEQDIFRGKPDWEKLKNIREHKLTAEEQSFLDNETETLCQMINDWDITQKDKDLPKEVWQYIKEKGFFGLVIDKKYGGKGFSAALHSDVVMKIMSRSPSAGVTVMVPNSLGPGELLHHYGTQAQKDQYLPKLASGQEIPCFALTSPSAGSDATSMTDTGIVCKSEFEGNTVVGIKLNFNKRYITLAPVATLIGLAIKLEDPEGLLNGEGEEGITCCLIPRTHPGIHIGDRHLPMHQSFMNGPITGEDVFIPIDWVIGGQKMAGQGWKMLVECLSIGRSISLPACGTALATASYTSAGAYSLIREQFKTPIGKFEGIEEKLSRIGGYNYIVHACRTLTLAAVDSGIKPSVASAIAKYHMTEFGRKAIIDAGDVFGGRFVIAGPNNYLANGFYSTPVSITVEGANILTRNLIIFGQGSICCHPYLRAEMEAAQIDDAKKGLKTFDKALFSHSGYLLNNLIRSVWQGITNGLFTQAPHSRIKHYYRQVARVSAGFAFVADASLLYLGGALKRKERLSARLGDVMAHLYMASAILKYYADHGEQKDELALAKWSARYCLFEAQEALYEFCDNFPNRGLAILFKSVVFPWGRTYKMPKDFLEHEIASMMQKDCSLRQRFSKYIYMTEDPSDPVGKIEYAFKSVLAAQPISAKIRAAVKEGKVSSELNIEERVNEAKKQKLISDEEAETMLRSEAARWDALQVDIFKHEDLSGQKNYNAHADLNLANKTSTAKKTTKKTSTS